MEKRLSEFVEEEGFKAVGSAANASMAAYNLEKLQEQPEHKGKQWIILPRSQVKGSAPDYVIYNKIP